MQFQHNDGGRKAAGYKGSAGDCVCRAIAIASGRPYQEIYERLAQGNVTQRFTRKTKGKRERSAANGIHTKRKWFKDYMTELGFEWVPTMHIGQGCKVHLREGELPMGRLVVALSKHMTSVIDGVINDTYDPQRNETRCVYGFYKLTGPRTEEEKFLISEYGPHWDSCAIDNYEVLELLQKWTKKLTGGQP